MDELEINVDQIAKDAAEAALAAVDARNAEAKAEAEREDALRASIREDVEKEFEAKTKAWRDTNGVPSFKKLTKLDDDGEPMRALLRYLRSGDETAARAALQEGTGSEGGFVVPEDWYTSIIEKRDAMSFPRKAGVQVINTSRDVVKLAAELTTQTNFSVVAEEGAYGEAEPTFSQVSITVHKFGKVVKVSEELMADEEANLAGYIGNGLARAMALTEAQMVATGTGSAQPEGISVGGDTDAVTFDSGVDTISSTDLAALYYGLTEGYANSPNAGWLMHRNSLAKIRQLTISNNWAFPQSDMDLINPGPGQPVERLWNLPVWTQGNVSQASDNAAFLCIGDFNMYALVERAGLVVARNPYLYQANGQIGIFAYYRQGGAVLLEEGFAWGNSA